MFRYIWTFLIVVALNCVGATHSLAVDPFVGVWKLDSQTQITYVGDTGENTEIVILICNKKEHFLDVQYMINKKTWQVLDADFFIIQQYPLDEHSTVKPYYPPARVIYNAGMGKDKADLTKAFKIIEENPQYNYAFVFERIEDDTQITLAWSKFIPGNVILRGLAGKDLTDCSNAPIRNMNPLQ